MSGSKQFASVNEFQTFCSVQRNEVPPSVALTPEGADYTDYFIGLDCYETNFHENLQHEYQARVQLIQKPVRVLW